MAYGKSYRYRKNYKRRNNRFSRFNLYRKRSSKAQALQLYKLNKRVTKLQRNVSPDIKRAESFGHHYFTNESVSAVTHTIHCFDSSNLNLRGLLNARENILRLRNFRFYGTMEYSDNFDLDKYVSSSNQRSATFRVIAFRYKASRSSELNINDIVDFASSGDAYDMNTLRPLKEGVSNLVKICYDKSYTISSEHPIVRFGFRLPACTLKTLSNNGELGVNDLQILIITGGLHWTSSGYQQVLSSTYGMIQYYNEEP